MTGPEIIEAVVQVGAEQTRYLRCGRGPRYIVVLSDDPAERVHLIREHATAGCVIAPMPDGCHVAPVLVAGIPVGESILHEGVAARDAASLESWLRGMLEGLGLDRPTVVLAAGLAPRAAELTASLGDRFELLLAPVRDHDR